MFLSSNKNFRNFFADGIYFVQSVNMAYDRHWLLVTENLMKKELNRGLEVKIMLISILREHNNGVDFIATNQIYCFAFDNK